MDFATWDGMDADEIPNLPTKKQPVVYSLNFYNYQQELSTLRHPQIAGPQQTDFRAFRGKGKIQQNF
jgi:hypothetical protein